MRESKVIEYQKSLKELYESKMISKYIYDKRLKEVRDYMKMGR